MWTPRTAIYLLEKMIEKPSAGCDSVSMVAEFSDSDSETDLEIVAEFSGSDSETDLGIVAEFSELGCLNRPRRGRRQYSEFQTDLGEDGDNRR